MHCIGYVQYVKWHACHIVSKSVMYTKLLVVHHQCGHHGMHQPAGTVILTASLTRTIYNVAEPLSSVANVPAERETRQLRESTNYTDWVWGAGVE